MFSHILQYSLLCSPLLSSETTSTPSKFTCNVRAVLDSTFIYTSNVLCLHPISCRVTCDARCSSSALLDRFPCVPCRLQAYCCCPCTLGLSLLSVRKQAAEIERGIRRGDRVSAFPLDMRRYFWFVCSFVRSFVRLSSVDSLTHSIQPGQF